MKTLGLNLEEVIQGAVKSSPLKFFAVFSATAWNFNSEFCTFICWNQLHL